MDIRFIGNQFRGAYVIYAIEYENGGGLYLNGCSMGWGYKLPFIYIIEHTPLNQIRVIEYLISIYDVEMSHQELSELQGWELMGVAWHVKEPEYLK